MGVWEAHLDLPYNARGNGKLLVLGGNSGLASAPEMDLASFTLRHMPYKFFLFIYSRLQLIMAKTLLGTRKKVTLKQIKLNREQRCKSPT